MKKKKRKTKEESLKNDNIPFSGWKALEEEKLEQKPRLIFVIKNKSGDVVRNIFKEVKSGINRTAWDLRYPNNDPIALGVTKNSNTEDQLKGLLAAPGVYSTTMYLEHNGTVKQLDQPVKFNVKPLYKGTLEGASPEEASDFWRSYEATARSASALDKSLIKAEKKIKAISKALMQSTVNPEIGLNKLEAIRKQYNSLKSDYYGNQARLEIGEKNLPTVKDKIFTIYLSVGRSTYGPTETNKKQIQIIENMVSKAENELRVIQKSLDSLEQLLNDSNGPYIDD